MPTPDNQVQVSTQDGVIAIAGRLDFTTATHTLSAVNEQLHARPAGSSAEQVIDLAAVTHSNSAGLALMIEWLAEAQRNNQSIRFKNIPDSLRQISAVCQVDSLI